MTRSAMCTAAPKFLRKSVACRKLFGPLDHIQLKMDYESTWNRLVDQCCIRWNFDFRYVRPLPEGNLEWTPMNKCCDLDSGAIKVSHKATAHVQSLMCDNKFDMTRKDGKQVDLYMRSSTRPKKVILDGNNEECDRLSATVGTASSDTDDERNRIRKSTGNLTEAGFAVPPFTATLFSAFSKFQTLSDHSDCVVVLPSPSTWFTHSRHSDPCVVSPLPSPISPAETLLFSSNLKDSSHCLHPNPSSVSTSVHRLQPPTDPASIPDYQCLSAPKGKRKSTVTSSEDFIECKRSHNL